MLPFSCLHAYEYSLAFVNDIFKFQSEGLIGTMNRGQCFLLLPALVGHLWYAQCSLASVTTPQPPPFPEKARMARYLVHYSEWGVVSALSAEYGGRAFGTLQSFADGPLDNSTGVPMFYVSVMSDTYKNVQYNNSVSFTLSQATGEFCKNKGWDPEEPVCSRVTLAGKMLPVEPKWQSFAKKALFSRHPAMADWPAGHDWHFMYIDIEIVHLLDFYGGAAHVPVADYFAAKP